MNGQRQHDRLRQLRASQHLAGPAPQMAALAAMANDLYPRAG